MLALNLVLAGLAGCAATPQQTQFTPPTEVPDLSGSWEVDYRLSEHVGDKLNYLLEVTRSHFNQMASNGDPRMGNARAYDELQGVYDLGRLTEFITKPSAMTITQADGEIVVERDGDYSLLCDFISEQITGNNLGHERCGWQGEQLVFELALPDGLYVRHRFVLADNGKHLNVATTVASKDVNQPFTINRVYIPFEPGEGMYRCEYTLAKKKICHLGQEP